MSTHLEKLVANSLAELTKYNINRTKIALAVSGGADSVAMLVLVAKWAKANNIQLIVMTVDHNVRVESKLECAYVKQLSERLGYDCYILEWSCQNNFANFQERAREGRYNLLTRLCDQLLVPILLVGHHLDDYLENYLFRINDRQSLLVLSTNKVTYINDVRVGKPLHKIKKSALILYLKNQKINWYEDASNLSEKYARNLIRKNLSEQGEEFKKELLAKINSSAVAAKRVHQQLIQAIAECTLVNNYGFAKINLVTLKNYSLETKVNLINYILTIVGGNIKIPNLDSAFFIVELVNQQKDFIRTLHSCVIKKSAEQLLIYYELGRAKLPSVKIKNYSASVWRNRFKYNSYSVNSPSKMFVSYLSINEYVNIKNKINLQDLKLSAGNSYKAILFTLPVIKTLEKLLAIPHISYYDHNMFEKDQFTFSPKFISRFTHFC